MCQGVVVRRDAGCVEIGFSGVSPGRLKVFANKIQGR